MKYFSDIGLEDISEAHLFGNWTVENRFINQNKHETVFLECNELSFFNNGTFKTLYIQETTGAWAMVREIDLIYNPQLFFVLEERQIGRAIITRLLTNDVVYKLTLYFSTGLELNLEKVHASF
jgi:hypothetical protein